MDKYPCFSSLAQNESEYFIEIYDRKSPVTIIAPHGGAIEPHTSDISQKIAGNFFNCYCFNGTRKQGNRDLHITSHKFNEPKALELLLKSTIVIAIHGCRELKNVIYIGGLDYTLRKKIAKGFADEHISFVQCPQSWPLGGTHPENICNRGLTGKGVQLEISRPYRDTPDSWEKIAMAIKVSLPPWVPCLAA